MSFIEELKRRNVVRVTAAYVVMGWVLAQVAEFAFDTFGAPDWALKSVVIVLVLGIPVVMFFAWAYEITPEGIKRDAEVRDNYRNVRNSRTTDRVIIGVLLVAIAWFTWDKIATDADDVPAISPESDVPAVSASSSDPATPAPAKSVAVLPFAAMSSGEDDAYFADGLTEEILNSLAALPDLMVTARTSSFSFKGKDLPVQEIAQVLNVEHIVEGSVRRSGDRLRVTAQLIRTSDGFHLWSETFDRDSGDTFTIQTDIAEKIALALDVFLDEDRRAAMAASNVRNPQAFVDFQKGWELYEKAHGQLPQIETLTKANMYFDRAIELEPGFFNAYVARNDLHVHTLMDLETGIPDAAVPDPAMVENTLAMIEENYDAAIRLAPDENRRLAIEFDRAVVLGNWRGLDRLIETLLVQPDSCYSPGWFHLFSINYGRAKQAVKFYERLDACNPLGDNKNGSLILAMLASGEFERVIETTGKLNDSGQRTNITMYIVSLIAAGRLDEAQAVIDEEIRHPGHAAGMQAVLDAADADSERPSRAQIIANHPNITDRIIPAARWGYRDLANQSAALADSRPMGHIPLMQTSHFCGCGAPFDLESTPNLARMIEESGIPWPPRPGVKWPRKDW